MEEKRVITKFPGENKMKANKGREKQIKWRKI